MKGLYFFPLLLLLGCTATKLTSSWTAPTAGAKNYRQLLVVSTVQNEDSVLRIAMEDRMVAALKTIGYNAIAFHQAFRPGALRSMRYDSVRQRLSEKGIDGVITIGLLAKESESSYVKDRVSARPESAPMGSFWESPATTVKQEIGKPGYYVTTTEYYWESNFYDVNTIALLYNARTTAFDVTSAQSLAGKYGKLIVDDLQKNYVLTVKR